MNIIFDLDGTLYASKELHDARYNAIIHVMVKHLKKDFTYCNKVYYKIKKNLKESGKPYNGLSVFSFLNIDKRYFYSAINNVDVSNYITEDKDLIKVLSELSMGHNIFILTNSPYNVAIQIIGILGIKQYIREIFSADIIGENKPNIKAYEYALSRIKALPKECVIIGDDIDKDLKKAKIMGFNTIALKRETNNLKNTYVDYFIKDIRELTLLL
ncbi:HAD family hydrolase [Candidatus Woesearchaeota archaeon]|nr:HAD family hydrolase [Candidatus Woesearchaeota archaeon]